MKKLLQAALLAALFALPTLPAWAGMTAAAVVQSQADSKLAYTRQRLALAGIDPASPQGETLLRWMSGMADSPAWRGRVNPTTGDVRMPDFLADLPLLPADQRSKLFTAMLDAMAHAADHCDMPMPQAGGSGPAQFGQYYATSSVPDIEAWTQALDTMAQAETDGKSGAVPYTTAQLLEADSYLTSQARIIMKQSKTGQALLDTQDQQVLANAKCLMVKTMIHIAQTAPVEMRDRLIWEMVYSTHHGGMTADQVINDPGTYALAAFDQPAMPDAMRAAMPAAGSRPLPFKKIVITGRQENTENATFNVPFILTFYNRQNNGTVIKVRQAVKVGNLWKFGSIETDLGYLTLKDQELSEDMKVPVAELMPASGYRAMADADPKLGGHYDIPEPLPNEDNLTVQHCDAEEEYPASRIAPNLTGKVLELACEDRAGTVGKGSFRVAYLYDYDIEINLASIDDDGVTLDHFDSVTIEQ